MKITDELQNFVAYAIIKKLHNEKKFNDLYFFLEENNMFEEYANDDLKLILGELMNIENGFNFSEYSYYELIEYLDPEIEILLENLKDW